MAVEKIMIVDDERLVRWSLRQKCEEWGYLVIEADAGEPALKLAQQCFSMCACQTSPASKFSISSRRMATPAPSS
jgi:CheY-like chemotaxis protein